MKRLRGSLINKGPRALGVFNLYPQLYMRIKLQAILDSVNVRLQDYKWILISLLLCKQSLFERTILSVISTTVVTCYKTDSCLNVKEILQGRMTRRSYIYQRVPRLSYFEMFPALDLDSGLYVNN